MSRVDKNDELIHMNVFTALHTLPHTICRIYMYLLYVYLLRKKLLIIPTSELLNIP
jgi:hypothetical protein